MSECGDYVVSSFICDERRVIMQALRSLSKDDGNGNENATKQSVSNNSARLARAFYMLVHFFAVFSAK